MKNYIRYLKAGIVIVSFAACSGGGSNSSGKDSIPSVVTPPVADTSAVKRTPPVNDSNVVNTDSVRISK
jgi:hypothetical protein